MKIFDKIVDAATDAVYALANVRVCLYAVLGIGTGVAYVYLAFASLVGSISYY